MQIERAWAMPNKETFKIKPIRELLLTLRKNRPGKTFYDPFSRNSMFADIRNDMDEDTEAEFHMPANEFLKSQKSLDFVLFDPPYTLQQCKEHYKKSVGVFTQFDAQNCVRWKEERDIIASKQKLTDEVLSFGYTSTCMGMKRGYEIRYILLVSSGPAHNDIIITLETKSKESEEK